MKVAAQRMIDRLVSIPLVWRVLRSTVIRAGLYAESSRHRLEKAAFERAVAQRLFPELTVRHGPFRGMRYPRLESVGSTILPKLLGSYEREIQPLIDRICATPYRTVIDVGCAEGYYAVGLAMRLPGSKVYAYDINGDARKACAEMARLNAVAERVVVREKCDRESLGAFDWEGGGLVVCDCEGFEKVLFGAGAIASLATVDLLIELHDVFDPTISPVVLAAFTGTHDATLITSVDDTVKARSWDYPELRSENIALRKRIMAEERPGMMEWAWLTPRQLS